METLLSSFFRKPQKCSKVYVKFYASKIENSVPKIWKDSNILNLTFAIFVLYLEGNILLVEVLCGIYFLMCDAKISLKRLFEEHKQILWSSFWLHRKECFMSLKHILILFTLLKCKIFWSSHVAWNIWYLKIF